MLKDIHKQKRSLSKRFPGKDSLRLIEDLLKANGTVDWEQEPLDESSIRRAEDMRLRLSFVQGAEIGEGIPWHAYSEMEIQSLLKIHFETLGYRVSWRHRDDPSHEKGIDLECVKKDNSQRIAIAVKKKPRHDDIAQVVELAKASANRLVYVYVQGASQSFLDNFRQFSKKIELWDYTKLEEELRLSNLGLKLVVDNSPAAEAVGKITSSIVRITSANKVTSSSDANLEESLRNLWTLKDRAVTIYKCASMLQLILERFQSLDYKDLMYMVRRGLDFLYVYGFFPITNVIERLPSGLRRTIKNVHDKDPAGSNWGCLWTYHRGLVPGNVFAVLRGYEKSEKEMDIPLERLKKSDREKLLKSLEEIAKNFQSAAAEFRRIAVWAYGLEATFDQAFERLT